PCLIRNSHICQVRRVGTYRLLRRKKNGSGWSFRNLGSDKFHSLGDNFITAHNYEPNVIPNRDGYLLYSTSKLWQLKRGQNGEESLIYSLPNGGLAMPVGSWDMEDFWSYMDRGKFQRYHASYTDPGADTSASWSAEGEPVRPNAPASFISEFINYSPDHGMLLMNHGQTNGLANDAPVTPMLLSGKRNDTWRIYSQVYNVPYSVENDPVLEKSYLNQIRRFPLADPQGLGVDPIDGSWISCGSMWGGAIFMNISDPKRDVAHFAAPNDLFKNFPGFVAEGLQQSWGTICVFSNPDFDTDGSIWMMYGNPFEVGGKHAKTQLKYMRSGDRKAFYEADASQYADLKGWSTIDLPTGSYPSWSSYVLCGKHPKNKNKVFAFLAGEFNTLIMVDHHGKPEDSDKVDITTISRIGNEHGWNSRIRYVSSVAEDPNTGDIIITGMDGLFIFDPSSPVVDGMGRGDYLTLRGGAPGDIVPTRGHMYKVIFDDEGRMWVGTRNVGVVGVNKERTEVIARYNTDNSPLPSDWVIGLGWNPETHSLMISTDQGLAEVFPDLPAQGKSASEPYLSMTTVSPNYNGTVEIRNITPGEGVIICDIDGNEVKRISTAESTTAEWDFKNAKGEMVPSGHYTITVGRNAPLPIVVMR
ncbi:MAG: hypothetical protein K2K97_00820, partial [Muribaculaceae bacterium]|nr:hypothetical protein [Muribaculaceae bacterium]